MNLICLSSICNVLIHVALFWVTPTNSWRGTLWKTSNSFNPNIRVIAKKKEVCLIAHPRGFSYDSL